MRTLPLLLTLAMAASVAGAAAVVPERGTPIHRLDSTTIGPAAADTTIVRLMRAAQVTGAAIAVYDRGEIALMKGYGWRDAERRLPITENTVFAAASLSKPVFAYLVMQLVANGRLDLDKPVHEYLPRPLAQYPAYADLAGDGRADRITARMLLDHTSGLPNWRAFEDDRKLRIHFEPGARYAYSGEGIDLLQLVVETITHQPLESLLHDRVFRPLGMTRTSMVWQPSFEDDCANAYDEYGRSLGPLKRTKAEAAASMYTTVSDFARFEREVMTSVGLPKAIHEEMLTPQIRITSRHQFPTFEDSTTRANDGIQLSYGLGWGLYATPYGRAVFKEGHDEGWRHYTVFIEPLKTGIIILTNSSNGEGIFQPLVTSLLRNPYTPVVWEGFTPYDRLPARPPLPRHAEIHVDRAVLLRYAGQYGHAPDLILTVRLAGEHLSVQENDEPAQELWPESQTTVFSKVADDTYTFVVDGQGRVTAMILHTGGKDIPLPRIEPPSGR
jgi:CubicO group peptidase (beta-lactamase class C family)